MKGVTGANPEVLQAPAWEDIRLSEEELLLAARSQAHGRGSANGALASLPKVSWYMAALCRLGIHKGPWGYLAEGYCVLTRECQRCGADTAFIWHQREWRYVGDSTCFQTRICTRCDAVSGHRTRHAAWSDSWPIAKYREAHRCLRCGVVHDWDTSPD